jgi:hypothetical protein
MQALDYLLQLIDNPEMVGYWKIKNVKVEKFLVAGRKFS